MRQQRVFRAFLQRRKHQSRAQRGKQNAGVLRHSVQQGSIVAAAPEGIHGVEHLPVRVLGHRQGTLSFNYPGPAALSRAGIDQALSQPVK